MIGLRASLRIVACFLVIGFAAIGSPTHGWSQDPIKVMGDANWAGIQGHYRAGHWTAIRLNAGDSKDREGSPVDALPVDRLDDLVVETSDGDGAAVAYRQPSFRTGDGETAFALAVPGSEAAAVVLRSGDETLIRTRLPEFNVPAKGPSMIPIGMPWVLALGDPLGIETMGANELLDRQASVAVTQVRDAAAIPDHVLALSGVDLMIVTSSGIPVLNQLQPKQRQALADWVRGGGEVFITLGGNAKSLLEAADWLADLLPGSVAASDVTRLDPSGLETFTSSQTRLPAFEGLPLPKTIGLTGVGELMIAGRTSRRVSVPFSVRYVAGFGRITVLAADLESDAFADWPQRMDLVMRLIGDSLRNADEDDVSESIRRSGYSDLAGQTRATLDRFSIKRGFSFAVLAIIIGALIALVGPLDYLLMRKLDRQTWVGWVTFPVVSIALSIGLWMAAQPNQTVDGPSAAAEQTSDSLLRTSSLEFIEVDGVTGFGRLFRWAFVYSHPSERVGVTAKMTASTDGVIDRIHHQVVAPFGIPGVSMGGIQIESSGKSCDVILASSTDGGAVAGSTLESRLDSLRLAPRSSKSIALESQFSTRLEPQTMKRRRGSELLTGELVNPLPVDLLDGMLIYQNWVYLLPTRLPAGGRIDQVDKLRQKNFRWQLSRQRALESSSENETWNVTDVNSPRRLAEMLMFHEAVGGPRYTVLRDEVLGHLDRSELLTSERCILVGRCQQTWSQLTIAPAGDFVEAPTDAEKSMAIPEQTNSFVRLVMPVVEVRR